MNVHSPYIEQEVGPGVYRCWLEDAQILMLRVTNTSRTSVDAYIAASIQAVEQWPQDKPYFALKELAPELTVTPYLYRRTYEVGYLVQERRLRGRTTLVASNRAAHHIIEMIIRADSAETPHMLRRSFTNRHAALTWLKEGLPNQSG